MVEFGLRREGKPRIMWGSSLVAMQNPKKELEVGYWARMILGWSLLISRPVVSLKASKRMMTVPKEARLARMMVRSSAKDVKEWGIDGPMLDQLCGVWLKGGGLREGHLDRLLGRGESAIDVESCFAMMKECC